MRLPMSGHRRHSKCKLSWRREHEVVCQRERSVQVPPGCRSLRAKGGFAFKPTIEFEARVESAASKIEHDSDPIRIFPAPERLRGMPVPKLLFSNRPKHPERLREERAEASKLQERWYRVQVPPGTRCAPAARQSGNSALCI